MVDRAHVAILMAVFQGREYLPDQLKSLTRQSVTNWALIAGDDGSTDGSVALLEEFAAGRPAGQAIEVVHLRATRRQQRLFG